MQLADLSDRVLARTKRANVSFPLLDVHYAIQTALNELDLEDYFSLVYTDTATATVNNPQVDISGLLPDGVANVDTAGIRPERVQRIELAYNDEGAWAAATPYALNDLVKGDGDPDTYYYYCIAAHTSSGSNEPGTEGGATYWTRTLWQHGSLLTPVDRDTLGRLLGDSPLANPYQPGNYFAMTNTAMAPGTPTTCAFLTQDILLIYPPPDRTYLIRMLIQYPLTEWDAGESGVVEIAVPNNILLPAIDGMCYWLDSQHPDSAMWRQRFDIHKNKVQGLVTVNAGLPCRDRQAYMDVTDGFLGRYPYPGWPL